MRLCITARTLLQRPLENTLGAPNRFRTGLAGRAAKLDGELGNVATVQEIHDCFNNKGVSEAAKMVSEAAKSIKSGHLWALVSKDSP
jgi:hypothetical protein